MKKFLIFVALSFWCLVFNSQSFAQQEQKISLNLLNAPLSTVVYALGKEAGLNIVANEEIKGKITIAVNNVSPYDALLAVLKASGLTYKQDNNILQIILPKKEAVSSRGEKLFSKKGFITKAFLINNLTPNDVEDTIKKLEFPDTKIFSSKGSNLLVIEAPESVLPKIDAVIAKLDDLPKQVLVESQIIEITAGNSAAPNVFGVQAKYIGSSYDLQTQGFANPASPGAPGFYAHVIRGNAEAFVETLENREGFNLLAHPKVVAISGKPANIISGSKLGYRTTITTQTGTIQNVDFLEVGTKLSFTPYVNSDGTIRMDIHPEVSEGTVTTDGLPQKQTTEATTTVIVKDGETIVIGGLIKNKSREIEKGVPIIMNIPIIGNFFKRKELTWEKKEIIAVITPHILTAEKIKAMNPEVEDLKKRQTDSNIGKDPGILWWIK